MAFSWFISQISHTLSFILNYLVPLINIWTSKYIMSLINISNKVP